MFNGQPIKIPVLKKMEKLIPAKRPLKADAITRQQGEIRLATSLTATPGFVTFSVTDTGSGVPPEQAEVIFERFVKLNGFVQGTGLGLSICREIAKRMGASIYLDTTYTAGGARFVFVVPVNPPEEAQSIPSVPRP